MEGLNKQQESNNNHASSRDERDYVKYQKLKRKFSVLREEYLKVLESWEDSSKKIKSLTGEKKLLREKLEYFISSANLSDEALTTAIIAKNNDIQLQEQQAINLSAEKKSKSNINSNNANTNQVGLQQNPPGISSDIMVAQSNGNGSYHGQNGTPQQNPQIQNIQPQVQQQQLQQNESLFNQNQQPQFAQNVVYQEQAPYQNAQQQQQPLQQVTYPQKSQKGHHNNQQQQIQNQGKHAQNSLNQKIGITVGGPSGTMIHLQQINQGLMNQQQVPQAPQVKRKKKDHANHHQNSNSIVQNGNHVMNPNQQVFGKSADQQIKQEQQHPSYVNERSNSVSRQHQNHQGQPQIFQASAQNHQQQQVVFQTSNGIVQNQQQPNQSQASQNPSNNYNDGIMQQRQMQPQQMFGNVQYSNSGNAVSQQSNQQQNTQQLQGQHLSSKHQPANFISSQGGPSSQNNYQPMTKIQPPHQQLQQANTYINGGQSQTKSQQQQQAYGVGLQDPHLGYGVQQQYQQQQQQHQLQQMQIPQFSVQNNASTVNSVAENQTGLPNVNQPQQLNAYGYDQQ